VFFDSLHTELDLSNALVQGLGLPSLVEDFVNPALLGLGQFFGPAHSFQLCDLLPEGGQLR
jgi:hypothetical protein